MKPKQNINLYKITKGEITMKKFITALILVLSLCLISGCAPKDVNEQGNKPGAENNSDQPVVNIIDEKDAEIEEFFSKYVDTDSRPVAVMIDNDDKSARPQAGLDEAYLVYEMVVEGGSTRFMALYNNTNIEKIGPVRSSRHYFLDFVMENDAIYTHFGWSPQATTDISSFGINNINGVLGSDGHIFWREEKYKGDWHSAYTNMEKILKIAEDKNYNLTTKHKNSIKYADKYFDLDSSKNATKIILNYSYNYKTGYEYNEGKKVYSKIVDNKIYKMQNSNPVEFKNIIIELIHDTALGDGTARRNINTVGTGKGYYITNGQVEEITWSKSSRRANTVYKKNDGSELVINPGKTIINLISPSYELVIE